MAFGLRMRCSISGVASERVVERSWMSWPGATSIGSFAYLANRVRIPGKAQTECLTVLGEHTVPCKRSNREPRSLDDRAAVRAELSPSELVAVAHIELAVRDEPALRLAAASDDAVESGVSVIAGRTHGRLRSRAADRLTSRRPGDADARLPLGQYRARQPQDRDRGNIQVDPPNLCAALSRRVSISLQPALAPAPHARPPRLSRRAHQPTTVCNHHSAGHGWVISLFFVARGLAASPVRHRTLRRAAAGCGQDALVNGDVLRPAAPLAQATYDRARRRVHVRSSGRIGSKFLEQGRCISSQFQGP